MTVSTTIFSAIESWQCGGHRLALDRPLIMGIINTTPDSFSDGGNYQTPESAYQHGMTLIEQGADILDIGGESTRPGATPVSAEEEKQRILPVIERLAAAGVVVSADTMKTEVMQAALASGAAIINDVNGFCAEGALAAVAPAECGLVIMHKRGQPRTMQEAIVYDDVVVEVADFLRKRIAALQAAGVARARLCVDPGIGFGKTRAHNITLMQNLSLLSCGVPVLMGVSRKSLFAEISNVAEERDVASAVAAGLLLARGANILRVHNVRMTKQALTTWQLMNGTSDE